MKKNVEKIKDISIVVLSIILVIYLILGINSISHGDKFGFFNLRFYIMSYDSQETNASLGDLVISTRTRTSRVKENDKIVYKKNNRVFINKVFSETNENNEKQLYVLNENNKENINDVDVIAKVACVTKGFGNMAMFLKSPIGMFNMFMIGVCIFLLAKKIMSNQPKTIDNNSKENKEE